MTAPSCTEGTVPFNVATANKECYTWYKLIGSLDAISPTAPPLVVLHGGPGITHIYLASLVDLYTVHGIPVIFYDQLGSGNSTRLPEKKNDGSFWTEALFLDELENLLAHFGLGGNEGKAYDVLGHSWGGLLGSRLAASERPRKANLRRLIITDCPSSAAKWQATQLKQLATLPEEVQVVVKKHEDAGTAESAEYKMAVASFHTKFSVRTNPTPEEVLKVFAGLAEDSTVTNTMLGPYQFKTTGTMKGWSLEEDIPKIKTPTLLMNGRDDSASDEAVSAFFYGISAPVKWVHFNDSSHMPHWEERERFMEVVAGYLRS